MSDAYFFYEMHSHLADFYDTYEEAQKAMLDATIKSYTVATERYYCLLEKIKTNKQ
jgi:hypothetical protein